MISVNSLKLVVEKNNTQRLREAVHTLPEIFLQFGQVLLLLALVLLVSGHIALQALKKVSIFEQLGREEVHTTVDGEVASFAAFRVVNHLCRARVLVKGANGVVLLLVVLCRHDSQHGLLALLKLEHAVEGERAANVAIHDEQEVGRLSHQHLSMLHQRLHALVPRYRLLRLLQVDDIEVELGDNRIDKRQEVSLVVRPVQKNISHVVFTA